MSNRTLNLTEPLYEYLLQVSLREPPLWQALRHETQRRVDAVMQISPEQGQFMLLLCKLLGVKRAIEVGTYTGYSALCVAAAIPADGELIACDINPETTAIAQRYWQQAGVTERITLRLAPALETIKALIEAGRSGAFDLAFIDADKTNYRYYYEGCLKLLRPGGVILIDNVLWSGAVIDPAQQDPDTLAIRELNMLLKTDPRVDISMLPLGDGLTLLRKRETGDG